MVRLWWLVVVGLWRSWRNGRGSPSGNLRRIASAGGLDNNTRPHARIHPHISTYTHTGVDMMRYVFTVQCSVCRESGKLGICR